MTSLAQASQLLKGTKNSLVFRVRDITDLQTIPGIREMMKYLHILYSSLAKSSREGFKQDFFMQCDFTGLQEQERPVPAFSQGTAYPLQKTGTKPHLRKLILEPGSNRVELKSDSW